MNSVHPPRFFIRLFKWYCQEHLQEAIMGDLEEQFEEECATLGLKTARRRFAWNVIRFCRPGIIKKVEGTKKLNHYGMVKNNFKLAWRNAIRHKQFTILNIFGLTIGISTCLLIGLFIHDEVSFDDFHVNGDRIYRVNQPNIWGDWDEMMANTGPNVATALREDAPELEEVTRLLSLGYLTVTAGTDEERSQAFKEDKIYAADENFFDVFSFKLIAGNPSNALQSPNGLIMTESTMKRYFGNDAFHEEVIGKRLDFKEFDGSWKTYQVSGIAADPPSRSHIQFDMLVSMSSQSVMMDMHGWKWIWTAFSTYGLVKEGTNVAALEKHLQGLPPKWAPPTTERIFNQSFEEFTAGNDWKLEMQPLSELYISGSPSSHPFGPTGNPQFIKIFGSIGLMVLILSAINFMNLSTARSTNRSKEVGVRKVLGSSRGLISGQFILESILYVIASTVLSFGLIGLILDPFNRIADKSVTLTTYLNSPIFYLIILGFVVALGFLAGSYPATYLSSFKPIDAFKGKVKAGYSGKGIRNGLVVFQFAISITLIICAFFVQKQLTYASKLDVGFTSDHILQLHNVEELGFQTDALKTRLEGNAAFLKVGKSFGVPPFVWSGDRYRAAGPDKPVVQLSNLRVEPDYLEVLDLQMLHGRNFEYGRENDKYTVILNEEGVKSLGWEIGSAIGQKVALASGGEEEFEVIGVVENFNFQSVKEKIAPLILIHHYNDKVWDYGGGRSYFSMRLNPQSIATTDDLNQLLLSLEEEMKAVDPTVPFEYSFMDQDFESTFRSERRMGNILTIFTLMALTIACLGLFGLAAFSAEQRTKELGIRKVLGASVSKLAITFSAEFIKLICVAILVACPIAWLLVSRWLQDFAYQTPIELWVFGSAIFASLLIAIITIGYQSVKTAYRNPVDTLKDE